MYKRSSTLLKLFCALFVATLVLGHVALGQSNPAHKEIEEIYAKRSKAIRDKNFAYLKTHQAKDYKEKSKDGTILDRRQADEEADQVFSMVKEVHEYSAKVDSIKDGDEQGSLIVEVSESAKMSFRGPDGKIHEMAGRGRSREVWKLSPQGWQLKFHEELESHVEVNGQQIK